MPLKNKMSSLLINQSAQNKRSPPSPDLLAREFQSMNRFKNSDSKPIRYLSPAFVVHSMALFG